MSCLALVATSPAGKQGVRADATPPGLGPANLASLYELPAPPAGAGQTVAVIDAMDDPNAEADLAAYRATFGLAPCTTANGCFHKVNQNGADAPLPAPDVGWALEISLDLDMVSAVCPACHLLLVEASSPTLNNLGSAVNTAVALGARFVANSYGGSESGTRAAAEQFYDHPGVAVTASAGGSGFGVAFPASAPHVVAVGGTTLVSRLGGPPIQEAWAGSGGGCSTVFAKPPWQTDTLCPGRSLVDVAAIADPSVGVAVFDTFGGEPGFVAVGGTSVGAPIIAGVYALAGTPPAGSEPVSFPYADPGDLFDVTLGPGAGPGYDLPTGLGTPRGVAAFRAPTP